MQDNINKTERSNVNNNNVDGVFAILTDMFGDSVTPDVIVNVCSKTNGNLESCIDCLIATIERQKSAPKSTTKLNKNMPNENDTDMDIVIESEEIQCSINDTNEKLNALEQELDDIQLKTDSTLNHQTYSDVIRKAPQHSKNAADIVDVPKSTEASQSNFKTRFHDQPYLKAIACLINDGFKVMIIMRGPPGCGKSHLAREIIDATTHDEHVKHVFSSDDFFYDRKGNYNFNPHRVGEAHEWNQSRVNRFARDGWSPIIVDNTNIKVWEMNKYLQIAVRFNYLVRIVEPNTSWSGSAGQLAKKNTHNVSKETIERMMINYELSTVEYAMQSVGLNYVTSPQYRLNPPLPSHSTSYQTPAPKTQRPTKRPFKENNLQLSNQMLDVNQYESLEGALSLVENRNDEWVAFEQERTQFWNGTPTQIPLGAPKPQRNLQTKTGVGTTMDTKDEVTSNLVALLKEKSENVEKASADEGARHASDGSDEKNASVLHKHCKDCKNENQSFAQIRQIYPSVPLEILWDLFEKCEGDGDWTMDILLKEETRIGDYENLSGNDDRATDNFCCDCDRDDAEILVSDIAVPLINSSTMLSNADRNANLSTYRSRRDRNFFNNEEQLAAKRMIEENVKIGDEHYSEHTRKIRNLRRGVNVETVVETVPYEHDDQNGACGVDTDEAVQTEEFLEIDLGMGLVSQLDAIFGVEEYQKETIKDMKTNVFLPKSLAQELYALWIESLHNQLEEQRQKSIKEDAEFAKQLHLQEKYPGLHKHSNPPTDLKDIIEMEYAWAAYKAEMDDWRSKTPQDLATQLTHDKLCDIFPNIDRDTLIEMLVAHNNKFAETVNVLKDTLKVNVTDKIKNEGRELLEQAQIAVEKSTTLDYHSKQSTSGATVRSLEAKKLDPETAKRSALKEFEECRNSAMHHAQLKAECYNKAKEAFQRNGPSVALYYSQIANLHKAKIDMYNHKAANCIMEVHELTQNNPDTLDLHYLHVNEAVECLDIFLDKHIAKIKTSTKTDKTVFVITGRGLHSVNGVATIKHRVKRRLSERYLTWTEGNPGLLKVRISTNSRVTVNIP